MSQQYAQTERTFLFTDIEGSTRLWDRFPAAMREGLARHDAILRAAIAARGGVVFKTIGDAFCVAFPAPEPALLAAVQAQRELLTQDWGVIGAVRVRMALHVGEAEARDGDYFGTPLNQVARMRDAAHGGQIITSAALFERLTPPPPGVGFLDRGAHKLRGLEERQHIYQVCVEGLPQEFDDLRTESTHPHNLPADITSFIGRDAECQAVRDLLEQADVRLVTLTGFGGAGKTRLALEVAERYLWRYPQGVWFADLSPLSDPSLVLPTLVRAIRDLEEDPQRTALEQLKEYFRTARALLVLDNFEQVADAADDLAELLRACPHVQVLATSRSLLYLSMEYEYEVPPLRAEEGASLFEARAQQVRPAFAVTEENRAEVEAICSRLDNIPLAVELAAAQVRMLSLAEIALSLDRRFQVLATKMRDLPPRHRSLRGAIDWSYDLLSETERRLFTALSVFVGGFTANAADAVCGPDCHHGGDTAELLTVLRDKSLVRLIRAERRGGQETDAPSPSSEEMPRYAMPESLRQYGAERLGEAEESRFREQHAGFYEELANAQRPLLRRGAQAMAAAVLEAEAANLRAGMDWMLENGHFAHAARYGVALRRFWDLKGWYQEGCERLERVLRHEAGIEDRSLRCELMYEAGCLWQVSHDPDRALRCHERSLELAEALDDLKLQARAVNGMGVVAYDRGDLAQAEAFWVRAVEKKRQIYEETRSEGRETAEEERSIAVTLNNLGALAFARGDYERARDYFGESLALREGAGDLVAAAEILNHLGAVTAVIGDLEEAREALQRSLDLCDQVGNTHGKAYALINLGDIAVRRQVCDEGRRYYGEALEILTAMEDTRGIAECQTGLGQIALTCADYAEAIRLARESLQLHWAMKDKKGLINVFELLAQVMAKQERLAYARTFLDVAGRLSREIGARRLPHEDERMAAVERRLTAGAQEERPAAASTVEAAIDLAMGLTT